MFEFAVDFYIRTENRKKINFEINEKKNHKIKLIHHNIFNIMLTVAIISSLPINVPC